MVERGTGFEPATTSLEGWCSATELPPRFAAADSSRRLSDDLRRGLLSSLWYWHFGREASARRTWFDSASRRRSPRTRCPPSRSLILALGRGIRLLARLRRAKADGQGGIRTPEGVSQQIYSLPPLAAWVPARVRPEGLRHLASRGSPRPGTFFWSWRSDLHRQPPVYKTGALLLSYASTGALPPFQPRPILGTESGTVKP
jgi:hypothetical protein